jgi:opacity protein-like surface antigen
MRRLLLAAMIIGAAQGAYAADMPDLPVLRGSLPDGLSTTRAVWQGYYVGGQASYGSSDESFGGSNNAMTSGLLSNTIIEQQMGVSNWGLNFGKQSHRSTGFGGFAGYNSQWDDVVIGIEGSYIHGEYGGSATSVERRISTLSDGYSHDVTSSATSAINITDMATLRGRAGYVMGNFLPYVFGGFALGNANISRSVGVLDVPTFASNPPPAVVLPRAFLSADEAQHNHLVYGYSAGVGVDVQLIGGLFARAEYEYVRFTSSVDTSINTVRLGLGYKF